MAENIPGVPPVPAPAIPPGLPSGPQALPPGVPRIGGATQPLANPGNQVAATAKIANAIKMLQDALPEIPMGSELHTTIFKIVPQLTKAIEGAKPDAAMQLQQIVRQAREQSQGSPLAALSRLAPAPGAGPAMPSPPSAPALPVAA